MEISKADWILFREKVADEMLAILSDRNRIMQKHEMEETNTKWNQLMMQGFDE